MTRVALRLFAALLGGALLASCQWGADQKPLTTSLIGGAPIMMRRALMQGLVATDAGGAIEPALAERWIVTDNGLSYIFRIRDTQWANGKPVLSRDVATQLKKAIADPRNPLGPLLTNVRLIVPMTGRVIEIQLKRPQPDFLHMLAQPELAIILAGQGTGPYRIHSRRAGVTRLRLNALIQAAERDGEPVNQANDLRVRAEIPALGVARFSAGTIDLVMGGTVGSLPIALAAGFPETQLKLEPARGLFGLQFMRAEGAFKDARTRLALSIALDRPALLTPFGVTDWPISTTVLPMQAETGQAPASIEALSLPASQRIAKAKALIGDRRDIQVRIAVPDEPGLRVIFAGLAAAWAQIGVKAVAVRPDQAADLRFLDEVAPVTGAAWYINRLGCHRVSLCEPGTDVLLVNALQTDDEEERKTRLKQIDAAITQAGYFIPIARPLRWSLVKPSVTNWRESASARHPLHRLRRVVR